jgi:monoterpene epsilon-lactone hydrolase
MPSIPPVAVTTLLRLSRLKARSTAEHVRRDIAARTARPQPYSPPRSLDRILSVTADVRHGWPTYQLSPRDKDQPHTLVLYLHGGAYISEISPLHWKAIARVAIAARAGAIVPIYPLAPHGTARTTVSTATDIAADLLVDHPTVDVTLIGESAGGGMALAVAQQLRDRYRVQPARIVLLSPWLDVTMTDPAISAIEASDAMLNREGLVEAGRSYAGDLDPAAPDVSPVNGDLTSLAPIAMFSGTHDILHPDALALIKKAHVDRVSIDYYEQLGGQHVYQFLPTRSGRSARERIAQIIAGTT